MARPISMSVYTIALACLLASGGALWGQTVGPDLIAAEIMTPVNNYGKSGDITGYAIGSVACNAGDQEILWVGGTSQHPVIGQQLYRLKDGRFEQIGMSWAKHEFVAVAENYCQFGCIQPSPYDGSKLGIYCSHPSSADLNGKQTRLGPRGQINAFTGVFPYYFTQVPYPPPGFYEIRTGRRLQVHDADLSPDLNVHASYYAEIQYVAADECAAGNGADSVSYCQVNVTDQGSGVYNLAPTGATVRQSPAIHAWKASNSSVQESLIQVPGEGLFILSSLATDLGGGIWHYEYALYNQTSDRSGRSFFVPVPSASTLTNIGFHDVDYHSGDADPYASGSIRGTDWPATRNSDGLTWQTEVWNDLDRQANALRWGTVYNFRFDANQAPADGVVLLGLYKPGTPTTVWAFARVPQQTTGACCLADTTCVPNAVASTCSALGGTWQGSGTVCSPNPCVPPPTGACCDPSLGTCSILTQQECGFAGGTYQGDNTTCNPNNCPQPPTGACCDQALGTCNVTIEALCSGPNDLYQGDGSSCEPNPCVGACCLPDFTCASNLKASSCGAVGGEWKGVGSQCETTDCTDPPIPTVSEWGNAALFMLLLAAASTLFRRRPASSRAD